MAKKKKLKYVAICIGVNDYANFNPLSNAVHDASAVADVFQKLGFDVKRLFDKDATHNNFMQLCDSISTACSLNVYDAVILYFAGHGFMTNLTDCLVLQDTISSDKALIIKDTSINVQSFLKLFQGKHSTTAIVIIDACRTDYSDYRNTRSTIPFPLPGVGGGPNTSCQAFIAYSTAMNTEADDIGGKDNHSPYTAALLDELMKELPIESIFKNVRSKIHKDIGDQMPWEYTSLKTDFYFNYGQLDPYYDAEYSKEAFVCRDYVGSDEKAKKILTGLSSVLSFGIQITKDFLLANKDTLSEDDLFVIGRKIYEMSVCNQDVYAQFMHMQTLKAFDGDTNHVLRGIYYEIYFDENDNLRSQLLGNSEMLTYIDRLQVLYKNTDAVKFVRRHVENKNGYPLYELWNLTSVVNIDVVFDDMYCMDRQDKVIYGIKSIAVNGKNMLSKVQEDALGVYDREQMRKLIADSLSIPMQRMKIRGLEKDLGQENRYVLCYVDNINQQLLDTINTNLPDEVASLSSNSRVEDLYDVIIYDVCYEGSEISIDGSCWVEVNLEFEGDDMGDWGFPGKFKAKLFYDETARTYSIIDGQFSVDTNSFYGKPD